MFDYSRNVNVDSAFLHYISPSYPGLFELVNSSIAIEPAAKYNAL